MTVVTEFLSVAFPIDSFCGSGEVCVPSAVEFMPLYVYILACQVKVADGNSGLCCQIPLLYV